jgi:hypothetical protein
MILLAGANNALLEGLAQALAHTGHRVTVAASLDEAQEQRARHELILTVVERGLLSADDAGQQFVRSTVAAGSALVAFREAGDTSRALPPSTARHVLADLVLPLERHRLVALAEHIATRARAVGRSPDVTLPESPAS